MSPLVESTDYPRLSSAFIGSKALRLPINEWTQLPSQLGVDAKFTRELKLDIKRGEYTYFDSYKKLLTEWHTSCQKNNNKPKLSILIDALEACKLFDVADTLREKFVLPPKLEITKSSEYQYKHKLEEPNFQSLLQNHVCDNTGWLSRCASANTLLLNRLLEQNTITADDITFVNGAPSDPAKTVRLFAILAERPTLYYDFIAALEAEKQFEAGWVLRKFYRYLNNEENDASDCYTQ